jgi:hypothetical protein
MSRRGIPSRDCQRNGPSAGERLGPSFIGCQGRPGIRQCIAKLPRRHSFQNTAGILCPVSAELSPRHAPDSPLPTLGRQVRNSRARGPSADRCSELVGVPRAFGMLVGHSPSAILSLPAFVSRSPPDNSCMYPSLISRSLCSTGIRWCTTPLAQSRNETNSSWVNGGTDKPCAIPRICVYGGPFQASYAATIKLTHYARLWSSSQYLPVSRRRLPPRR